jgi:hypothetical protein
LTKLSCKKQKFKNKFCVLLQNSPIKALVNKNILFAKKNESAAEQSGQQKENKTLPGCSAQ